MMLPKRRYGSGGFACLWLCCVVTALAATQATPDFSGQWILESASEPGPNVPRTLSVRHSPGRIGRRGDIPPPVFETIAIDRALASGVVSESHQIGIVRGIVGGIVADAGKDGRPTGHWTQGVVKWEGGALIFEDERGSGPTRDVGRWTERREVWSIDDRGRLHVAITSRSSESPARSLTLLYRRP